jgi:hypothetical protein
MDREKEKADWSWLPQRMPGVARLIAEKRKQLGAEWVNTCWRRGVVEREPGWFYAAEGALAVGTPWPDDQVIADLLAARITATQALLVIRQQEAVGG